KQGQWCPICSSGISERICRFYFESLFNEIFPKSRPAWLLNPISGRKLELDGYSKKLGIAFEYQGIQHYCRRGIFNRVSLEEQRTVDQLKQKSCEKNNVVLIQVPYTIAYDDLEHYIRQQCAKRNIVILKSNQLIDYKKSNVFSSGKINEMHKLAMSRNGLCLSESYINQKTKLKWMCERGHKWNATPDGIKNGGNWCPICSKNIKGTIEEMRDIARSRGGLCLSYRYINNRRNLTWRCAKGHEWNAKPDNIKHAKSWCPYCYGRIARKIDTFKKFSKKRNSVLV
ncbi:MAG: zinc-ribbon domain-containing protein, partial [archaeon]